MKKFKNTMITLLFVVASIFYSMSVYSETVFKDTPLYSLPKQFISTVSSQINTNKIESYEIPNITPLCQFPELPTGCEITSTAMLLNWYGINVTKIQLADAVVKYPVPVNNSNGILVGENPNKGFIGNPYDNHSYGMYNKAVEELADRFSSNNSLNVSGYNLDYLLSIVASKRPVVAWVTINFQEPHISSQWSTSSGEQIKWLAYEHAVLIIGFNTNTVIIFDPLTGKRCEIDKHLFELRYNQMGMQALTMRNNPRS